LLHSRENLIVVKAVSLQSKCFLRARECFSHESVMLNSKREDEMGRVKGSRRGGGEREGELRVFFSLPSPSPTFTLAPTLRVALPFILCHKIKDGGYNNINKNKQLLPPPSPPPQKKNKNKKYKICLHYRLEGCLCFSRTRLCTSLSG